ncbi:hypothetical protein DL766_002384 [Monosporascus sp. MC13-8B]|uniref:Uncharacterized protein n=1 Tax=Monosporascus cannonballus TaxID=155416 RepID=A0ABY0GSY2_9PEZI|nr:hypothetical protein DL762_009765 [Monosporascus cannonballus]RYP35731.1 hypothetical protein DL766_002384 [Monosporascus sp. MC13-8B]
MRFGIDLVSRGSIEKTRKAIRASGGDLVVKMAPTAVDSSDDARLQALMEQRERENAEVSGDEDSDDGSDDGNIGPQA